MILLIGGEKGGTGKSTISTNIAVTLANRGCEIIIVDCDPQGTSTAWLTRRNKFCSNLPKVFSVQKTGDTYDTIKDLSTRYQHVIIDAGGRDSEELRTAMVACEKMYIPLKASQPDLDTTKHMTQLIKLAKSLSHKLDAYIIISMASTHYNLNEDQEAIHLLETSKSIKVSDVIIHERKVYRDAIADGKGVTEYNNLKATTEINLLMGEVFQNEKF
jgi:chromosome partitioning protein